MRPAEGARKEESTPSAWQSEVRNAPGAGENAASAAGHGLRAGLEAFTSIIGPDEDRSGDLHILPAGPGDLPGAMAPGGRLDPGRGRHKIPALGAHSLNHRNHPWQSR
jgi:hypothetical protein